VKAAQYSVVAFPKLDNEAQLQRVRERFGSWSYDLRPYVSIVLPFTPLNIDELQRVTDHIGSVRRRVHPFAVSFHECSAVGDALLLWVMEGREQLAALRTAVHGSEPLTLQGTGEYEPALWLGRVRDVAELAAATADTNRIGRTIGVVDSLSLIRGTSDDATRLVLTMPFGVGRVDYHDRFPA
jgi:hypothetical protein